MNPYQYPVSYDQNRNVAGDRFGFALPFLVGAGIGGVAVGLTRPRPIYNVMPYQPYPIYPRPAFGGGYYNYGYYPYY